MTTPISEILNLQNFENAQRQIVYKYNNLPDTTPNIYDLERTTVPRSYSRNVYYTFFCTENLDYISLEITNRLKGVHPDGKNIIVPKETILSVMDNIYNHTFPDPDKMTMMVIEFITNHISNEFGIEANNNKLSAWIQIYPEESGMQRHPQIKLKEKTISQYTTQWNY
jgi:hypothetical protein